MDLGNRPLSEVEFVAFDLETTGLFAVACRIVEFGAVRFCLDGTELGRFEQLVDPECPIPRDAMRVHRITDAMVRGAPKVAEVLPRFIEFLGSPDTILLAHNAPFDLGFLGVALAKQGRAFPPHAVVDTLGLARNCLRGPYSFRLEAVAYYLGVAESEEHRALSDARLAAGVLRAIIRRTRGLRSVADLFHRSPPLSFGAASGPLDPPPGYEQIALAIQQQLVVEIVYDGGTRGLTRRRVTPLALLETAGRAYLTAYCHADQIEKTYRLDRIRGFWVEGD